MILPLLLLIAGAEPAHAHQEDRGAAERIILFGAYWCAPCMAEFRALPALVPALAPRSVTLAWIDEAIAVPSEVDGRVDTMPAKDARDLAGRLLGEGYGLPSTVVFDRAGAACAIWRAPLRVADMIGCWSDAALAERPRSRHRRLAGVAASPDV